MNDTGWRAGCVGGEPWCLFCDHADMFSESMWCVRAKNPRTSVVLSATLLASISSPCAISKKSRKTPKNETIKMRVSPGVVWGT
jgi:hypothetical protein